MKLCLGYVAALFVATASALVGLQCTAVLADPLPGEVLKFQQLPLNNGGFVGAPLVGAPFPGHDEWSTATWNGDVYQGTYMADDFADKFSTPVVHIRWWGSYQNNFIGTGVKRFLISFETDIPAGADQDHPWSHPGAPILTQTVSLGPLAPASSTFTEVPVTTPVSPAGAPPPETLFQYNAELDCPFPQQPDTVYWLKIVALVDPERDGPLTWGWHDRDWGIFDPLASTAPFVIPGEYDEDPNPDVTVWHFQDDAVQGGIITTDFPDCNQGTMQQAIGPPQFYIPTLDGTNLSKDLAFELYTIPEPASIALMSLGALALAVCKRRLRKA